MKRLLLLLVPIALATSACSKLNKALDNAATMDDKLDNTNKEIHDTNHYVYLQALLVGIQQIVDENNMAKLYPVPTSLMPAAKVYAEVATPEDIILLAYAWIKEIEEVNPVQDANPDNADPTAVCDKAAPGHGKASIDKYAHYMALMAIASFIPNERTEENHYAVDKTTGKYLSKLDVLKNTYILGYDRYQDTALKLLMMRVAFTRDVDLDASLLGENLATSGSMNKAIEYMKQVDEIISLPYAARIGFKIKDKVCTTPMIDISMQLDKATIQETANFWTRIYNNSVSSVQVFSETSWSGNSTQDKLTAQREVAKQNAAIAVIKSYKDKWANQLK
jgi:hypothetical protein